MERYVAYMRVSTERQGRSGLGLAAQRKLIAEFVEGHGELHGEFIEIQSGRKANREILWQAIKEAQKQKAKLLIARLDRFSRSVSFIAQVMEQGIGLTIAEMPTATDFQLHIFAALAQEERRLISVRTKAALQEAKRQGKALGVNGSVLAERRKKEAQEFAEPIWEQYLRGWQGLSYSEMARRLNSEGVPTRGGGKWYPQTVRNYFRDSAHR
jgi:DNA invertase Pin-like site-specific DNA recombinase